MHNGQKRKFIYKRICRLLFKVRNWPFFIYDNNDKNTEKISEVLNKSYKNKVTIFENISDKITNQPIAFTNCYNENKYNYDWIFMIDIDEYLKFFILKIDL